MKYYIISTLLILPAVLYAAITAPKDTFIVFIGFMALVGFGALVIRLANKYL